MKTSNMLPICTALKILSTIENISFILYVYYCRLNHLFCQILVGTPRVVLLCMFALNKNPEVDGYLLRQYCR